VPRINADSVAEHVAQQEAAVLDAAVRLFVERGYRQVGLADIAAEVGLARSSLYRYVPDKTHLLVEWYRREVPRQTEQWRAVLAGKGSPLERIQQWALAYLGFAQRPEHVLISELMEAMPGLDEATRDEVAARHAEMMAVVSAAVAEAGVSAREVDATVALLAGLVLGAARAEAPTGPDKRTRARLRAAVDALVGDAPPSSPQRGGSARRP
jgi:AcrR family transcriptional regulator